MAVPSSVSSKLDRRSHQLLWQAVAKNFSHIRFCRPNARWLSLLDDFVTTNFGTHGPCARVPPGAKFWRRHCTHALTHSRMDRPKDRMPRTPFFNGCVAQKCWRPSKENVVHHHHHHDPHRCRWHVVSWQVELSLLFLDSVEMSLTSDSVDLCHETESASACHSTLSWAVLSPHYQQQQCTTSTTSRGLVT